MTAVVGAREATRALYLLTVTRWFLVGRGLVPVRPEAGVGERRGVSPPVEGLPAG